MDYKKVYDEIMNIDPKIILVTICDNGGKIMHSGHRQGVSNLLTPEERKDHLILLLMRGKREVKLHQR
jgi:hypothetical protein